MRAGRSPLRSPTGRRRLSTSAAVVGLVGGVGACQTARVQVEAFPPIVCHVTGADGDEQTASVEVDGPPASLEVGGLTFGVEYRSRESGRVLEATVWRAPEEVVERVTYVIPGKTSLENEFGSGPSRLTGEHEVTPQGVDGLVWSCSVGRGAPSGEAP